MGSIFDRIADKGAGENNANAKEQMPSVFERIAEKPQLRGVIEEIIAKKEELKQDPESSFEEKVLEILRKNFPSDINFDQYAKKDDLQQVKDTINNLESSSDEMLELIGIMVCKYTGKCDLVDHN